MKKIILNLIIYSLLAAPAWAQTGNEISGSGAGTGIDNYDDFNTGFGDSTFHVDARDKSTTFGVFAGYRSYTNSVSLGYKASMYSTSSSVSIGVNSGYTHKQQGGPIISSSVHVGHYATPQADGDHCVLIGENTGKGINNGDDLVAIGHNAGYHSPGYNLMIGHNAGYNSSKQGNIAVGNYALGYGIGAAGYGLTTGFGNALMGASAGSTLAYGEYNTMIGTGAGGLSEGVDNSTFIGGLAGYNSGKGNTTTADDNTMIGYKAGYINNKGSRHTIIGANADLTGNNFSRVLLIGANSSGGNNYLSLVGFSSTGVGEYGSGVGNEITIDGERAIGLGYQTQISTAGAYSTSMGYQSSMTGSSSIGIGYLADVQSTTAVAIGSTADLSGDYSTILGASDTISGTNATAIGYGIAVANDHQINIGNEDIMSISGVVNWTTTSDGRLKTGVNEDIPGLDFIRSLRPVSYELTTDGQRARTERYTGFIAQEVAQAAQAIDYDFSGIDRPQNEQDRYGLRYSQFTVPLVKAVQELHQSQSTTTEFTQSTSLQTEEMDALLEELEA
ncbi:MAG: tail fiber domain-containing protein, partial [Bacteroidota bacterium]